MRRRIVLLTILFGLFFTCEIIAQSPGDMLWSKTFGGVEYDAGKSLQQTTDGGYIIAGNTYSFGPSAGNNSSVYLIKTDNNGDTLWTRTYGSTDEDYGNSVQQTSDGGYIIAGYTGSFFTNYDVYLIKTNPDGDILWTRTYGTTDDDYGNSVQQTSDGGYIIAGYTGSFFTDYNVYLIRTNPDGDTLWTRTYGTTDHDYGNSVQQTSDGGYIIAGYTGMFMVDIYLIKTDGDGNTLWSQPIGGTANDYGNSVQQTSDGGYIIAGYSAAYMEDSDIYLMKTNPNGDTLWTRTYDYEENEDQGKSVQQTSDGGYIIAGSTGVYPDFNVSLIKTDISGDTIWTKKYGGTGRSGGNSVQQTSDGGYIIAGHTETSFTGGRDVYLLKIAGNLQLNPPQNLFVTDEAYATWEAPSSKDLLGYNIYLDGSFVEYTTDLFYQYTGLSNGQSYVAGVSAVYDEGESEIIEFPFTYIYTGVESNIIPTTEIFGNFPNPLSHTTTIKFSVENPDKNTEITIYNFNGQRIKTLVDKKLEAGSHQVVWDGTNAKGEKVSPGNYFYMIKTGNLIHTRKMILIK